MNQSFVLNLQRSEITATWIEERQKLKRGEEKKNEIKISEHVSQRAGPAQPLADISAAQKIKAFSSLLLLIFFLTLLWQIPAQTAFQGNLETASAAASFSHLCMLHLSGAICMEICLSSKSAFLS